MSQEIRPKSTSELAENSADSNQRLQARSRTLPTNPLLFNPFLNSGFFSFTYTYRELSNSDGKTQMRGQQVRYENGKLSSEEFEGTGDARVYDQAVESMQNLVVDSMNIFLSTFSAMLPMNSRKRDQD